MGQTKRTTKLLLDLGKRTQGGANTGKRGYLEETAQVLKQGRAFSIEFFLAHAQKFQETVVYYCQKHLQMRERLICAHELLTWAEAATVATADHPGNLKAPSWFSTRRVPNCIFLRRKQAQRKSSSRAKLIRIS